MRSPIRHNLLTLLLPIVVCLQPLLGDYAWIPDYHHLQTKVGIDYTTSGENFGSDSIKSALKSSDQSTSLQEFKFWVEGEYGFVKDWSAFIRLPYTTAQIDNSTDTLFSGSGFSDFNLGMKWNLLNRRALITLELLSRMPLYSTESPQKGDLVLGDGSFDIGTLVHIGYRFNRQFAAGFSPGLMIRSSGYESAFVASAFAGAAFNPLYFRLIAESYLSFSKPKLSSPASSNSLPGSGGSFARLSKNLDSLAIGTRVGVFLDNQYRLEGVAMWSVLGSSAPVYFRGGLNLVADFDYYEPEKPKTKVREIPFETEQQPFDKNQNPEFGAPTQKSPESSN